MQIKIKTSIITDTSDNKAISELADNVLPAILYQDERKFFIG